MKFGLFVPTQSPHCDTAYLEAIGLESEERGYHSIWLGEHVVLFDQYASDYPYAHDGKIPVAGDRALLEPFTTLAFLAARTKRVRLGTGICLVPQRNPVYTAKEVANLDWISNGRFDFGVGLGWLSEEFEALGVPFAKRAARCRSYLEVMRRLWCDDVSVYEDEFYSLPACRQYPKPIQSPHPPIHFGGESDAALRRVAEIGQGWYGFNLTPDEFANRMVRLRALLEDNGRTIDDIEVSVSPYYQTVDVTTLRGYRDAGADQVILLAMSRTPDGFSAKLDGMDALIKDVQAG
ncbi:MAG: LLM class F420-dependent oxidoreductase [Pseudomonadota bacterium]